jgi:hypothetical protein
MGEVKEGWLGGIRTRERLKVRNETIRRVAIVLGRSRGPSRKSKMGYIIRVVHGI